MRVFADTSYFEACLNRHDQFHKLAVEASKLGWRELVTTEFVLIELAASFSKPADRGDFVQLDKLLRSQADVHLEPVSPHWMSRGLELYAARPDKAWSLTDCISFLVMQEHQLTEALSTDHHFVQAGFKALLLPDK